MEKLIHHDLSLGSSDDSDSDNESGDSDNESVYESVK